MREAWREHRVGIVLEISLAISWKYPAGAPRMVDPPSLQSYGALHFTDRELRLKEEPRTWDYIQWLPQLLPSGLLFVHHHHVHCKFSPWATSLGPWDGVVVISSGLLLGQHLPSPQQPWDAAWWESAHTPTRKNPAGTAHDLFNIVGNLHP